ncbi:hypothetical protein Tco_1091314 [Tanacetum coccineum]|uniref:Uncharacterized protein n=1 Tax=Tanacetum coccineum TaxID=301880 RepID=A0ABQ5I6V2_9ASTR
MASKSVEPGTCGPGRRRSSKERRGEEVHCFALDPSLVNYIKIPFLKLGGAVVLIMQGDKGVCPTFDLMKGTCKSLTELEYFCEEVYKATTEKLDWINPEGRQYHHDLLKPLPFVLNSQGCHVIPFHHFINNDLEYLRGGESSRKYSTSVTKTKAADYGHIKGIEDLVPNSMWTTRESARDVYSKRRIIAVTKTFFTVQRKVISLTSDPSIDRHAASSFMPSWVLKRLKKLNLTKHDNVQIQFERRDAYTHNSIPEDSSMRTMSRRTD